MGILGALVDAATNVVKTGVDVVTPSTGSGGSDTATVKTTDGRTVTVAVKNRP
jgi:hypothetical protein